MYIVIHRQSVSLYQCVETRRTLEAGIETRLILDLVSDRSANKRTTSA